MKLLQYEKDNKFFAKQAHDAIERATQLKKYTSVKLAKESPPEPNTLTQREIQVLKSTSVINGITYMPWDDSDGIIPPSDYLYCDPHNLLPLSQEQKMYFSCWKRPSQINTDSPPVMINIISAYSITQSVVTDCSFVASLSVAAAFERRHNKKLITSCIHPQDSSGNPSYQPQGHYVVKLYMNGVARGVHIDDLFPVSADNRLLCSHSTNKSEMWVSLIEKAYMKLNGGYDFPGSNSGIDLHALTGWVPEEITLDKLQPPQIDLTWRRLEDGMSHGRCVATISTGNHSPITQSHMGLHACHAYAVLDVRTLQDGTRLLQLKNPWTRNRWKGKYSPDDKINWTVDKLRQVNYDVLGALQNDNGVFWVDYESVLQYFVVMHVNWDPNLFHYKTIVHDKWEHIYRPMTGYDRYHMNHNPQYYLTVNGTGQLWIMLTKHVTSIQSRNNCFMTCHVYHGTSGCYYPLNQHVVNDAAVSRIFYNEQPLLKGKYCNDPHQRLVMDVKVPGVYKIVISQYEQIREMCYTLKVYGNVPCKLNQIPYHYVHHVAVKGAWNQFTSGGNSQLPTYRSNPQYKLTFLAMGCTKLRFTLDTSSCDLHTNVSVFKNNGNRVQLATVDKVVGTSGNYRNCACCLDLDYMVNVEGEALTLVVSSFHPRQEASFSLGVESTNIGIKLEPL
ncbi:hypothetical protein AKO1_013358 [Acrasis kona]|uniref:Calpain catalytic domain-containing protein n=1 Tax=Acrasis kona TaxID=1008807 RepID=A0AAW2Z0K6_9EUKA